LPDQGLIKAQNKRAIPLGIALFVTGQGERI